MPIQQKRYGNVIQLFVNGNQPVHVDSSSEKKSGLVSDIITFLRHFSLFFCVFFFLLSLVPFFVTSTAQCCCAAVLLPTPLCCCCHTAFLLIIDLIIRMRGTSASNNGGILLPPLSRYREHRILLCYSRKKKEKKKRAWEKQNFLFNWHPFSFVLYISKSNTTFKRFVFLARSFELSSYVNLTSNWEQIIFSAIKFLFLNRFMLFTSYFFFSLLAF